MPQGRAGGPLVDIVEAACEQAGLNCRVSLVPWIRPGSQLDGGPCDAVFPIEDSRETRPYMTVSVPVVSSPLAFFTLNPALARLSDLTEFIILARGPSQSAGFAQTVVDTLDKSALVIGPELPRLVRRFLSLNPSDRVALFGNYHVVTRAISAEAERMATTVPAMGVLPHRQQTFRVGFSRTRVPGPVIDAFNAALGQLHDGGAVTGILEASRIGPPAAGAVTVPVK
jgi:polar amino acid transport system substrate-binding protein